MWEPAMDARRYRGRCRWSVAWEAEGGRGGQAVELSWREERWWRSVGRAHDQQTAAPPFTVGCVLRKLA